MSDTISVTEHGAHAVLAAHPVTRQSYKAYLHTLGLPIPPSLAQADNPANPVTYVSQVDALAYCRWLGGREGYPYRLPTMAELLELADDASQDGISPEVWPHLHGNRPELRGGMKEMFLCEWTMETESVSPPGAPDRVRVLGSIFYPPWLREGSNAVHAQANLLATEGYSFVTFRVARDL